MRAIDAELAERAENQKVNGSAAVSTGTEPMGCDPLTVLSNEYGAEWKVWKPGRYVADHLRMDVSLVSDSVSGLAEKLAITRKSTRPVTRLIGRDWQCSYPGPRS